MRVRTQFIQLIHFTTVCLAFCAFWLPLQWGVVAVINLHVFAERRVRRIPALSVFWKPIFAIPVEPFLCNAHASHMLTLVRVRLKQHERFICW